MGSHPASKYCFQYLWPALNGWYPASSLPAPHVNLTNLDANSLYLFCNDILNCESNSVTEGEYSAPMVLIGIYISIASLFCIFAMALDLLYGFRSRKFWFPTKYFSLNAASITVITVAMKLPVDLSSPMPTLVDQTAKVGGLAFMCTMMSNLMPSLASMDNKSLLANVIGLSILVITLIANIVIQISTHLIDRNTIYGVKMQVSMVVIASIYMGMLLFLLMILISSAITLPATKNILESKYQAASKTTLNNQHEHENQIPTIEKLRQLVKRYWIMAQTGSPQFVMASNPLSSASGIICAISMLIYMFVMWQLVQWHKMRPRDATTYRSVYKGSIIVIVITQSIGIVVGSIAPILRCFSIFSFKSFAKQNGKHFLVFKVEKYWTQKLYEWKQSRISFLSGSRRSRGLLHDSKKHILFFCIGFQKVIVVSCKIIGLVPIVVIILVIYYSYCFKAFMAMLFPPPNASSSDDTNEDLINYVLLLEDNMQLAEKTVKGISDSMTRLIQKAEKKQHNNISKLLEKSVTFDGVETFDTDQIPSLPSIEYVNTWSLPIISLTCIAVAIPDIHKDRVDNLLKSVGEGLLYTYLVEESLNRQSVYVNIRRATVTLWHEVEDKCKWLGTTLNRSAYKGKTAIEIIKSFAHKSEAIVSEFSTSTNGEVVEKENLPPKVIIANSMYRVSRTIVHMYQNNNLKITEDELFTRLSGMIADILAACLTNISRVVTMRCHESAIEKREAGVLAAIDLLGRTTDIIKKLETRDLPNMDPDKMGFIDEWRLHLKQP